ncbi:MAG: glycosyltransferase family 4 protein [Actinomycetota bacterium]|nr:glycosyltransferase family 4 protein [Actinomycetota bacterium]
MRIALLQPCYWPEVRRGTERVVHDLGAALAARGHEVTLITSHAGGREWSSEDGMRVLRTRRPPKFAPLRWYEDHLDSLPAAMLALLRGRFDVAHAFHPAYAWGAAKAKRLGGPPFVFSFHGIPERAYLVQRRYRLEMMKTGISGADRVTVLSTAAAIPFRRYLLVEPEVLPGGVVGADFAVRANRPERPTLVCAASLGDPRKRAELLFAAFAELRRKRPEAALRIVRTRDPFMSPLRPSLPDGAEWVDGDSTSALARAYASAHASVLTSAGEAFGLVALESLAAGTPVIAARGSAPAELLDEGRTGELFSEDEGSLAEAMDRGLELGERDGAVAACRSAAESYDWERLVARHEALYEAILDEGRSG